QRDRCGPRRRPGGRTPRGDRGDDETAGPPPRLRGDPRLLRGVQVPARPGIRGPVPHPLAAPPGRPVRGCLAGDDRPAGAGARAVDRRLQLHRGPHRAAGAGDGSAALGQPDRAAPVLPAGGPARPPRGQGGADRELEPPRPRLEAAGRPGGGRGGGGPRGDARPGRAALARPARGAARAEVLRPRTAAREPGRVRLRAGRRHDADALRPRPPPHRRRPGGARGVLRVPRGYPDAARGRPGTERSTTVGEGDRLRDYHAKRDFGRTGEPRGRAAGREAEPRFVVQIHDARRMHFDFRLQVGDVLKSWSVPRGPSADPRDKRLAVPTEDHPLEYEEFEGVIPQGEYGGGTVIVWDLGTYEPLSHDRRG